MAKLTSNEDLAQRIEELVREHIAESQRTAQEAVARAFTLATVRASSVRTTATATKRRMNGRRRTADEVAALGERLYAAVCANPGAAMVVFVEEIGASSVRELQRPMTLLKKAGRIRSVGSRHLTRYFPMASDAASA